MNRAELRRRIEAITAAIRPADSRAARIVNLTEQQHYWYQQWRESLDEWHRAHPGEQAYRRMLDGDPVPKLCRDVAEVLGIITATIPETATVADAAEVYRKFASGETL